MRRLKSPSTFSLSNALLRDVALFAAFFVVAIFCLSFVKAAGRVAAVWPANAVLFVALLRAPPGHVRKSLAIGWLANLAANLTTGDALTRAMVLSLLNAVEVALGYWAVTRVIRDRVDLARPRHLFTFLGLGAVLPPIVSSAIASGFLSVTAGAPLAPTFVTWWVADALGLVIFAPALLILADSGRAGAGDWTSIKKSLALFSVLGAALCLVFLQSRLPLLYVIPPILVLLTFQLGLTGGAWGVLITAVFSIVALMFGRGPAILVGPDLGLRVQTLQTFLAFMALTTLPLASVLGVRRQFEESIQASRVAAEQSEARYRQLAEVVPDLIVRVSPDGIIQYASPAAARYGYNPGDLVGRPLLAYLHPDDAASAASRAKANFASGSIDPSVRREQRVRTASGEWVWLEGNPAQILGPGGQVLEVVNAFRDVTRRRQLEDDLHAAVLAAEHAAQVKTDFLANMSHEIRTPLTAIVGFSKLLQHGGTLSGREAMFASRIDRASQSLLTLVNDILDISKIDAGGLTLANEPFDLAAVASESLDLVMPQASAKGLDLRLDLTAPSDSLFGDADRLRQVLVNLLGNAVKFTESGSVSLTISLEETGGVTFAVTDSGIGIDPSKTDHLFDRFTQADSSATREKGGTGLGLAISAALVAAMGGRLSVRSELGVGSTFTFCLPSKASKSSH
ncbi:MAG: ATP-binding protein [Caulobacter sp.]